MKKILFLLSLLLGTASQTAGQPAEAADEELPEVYRAVPKAFRYRVCLTDKKNSPYSKSHPEAFLSPKSIERRRKFKLKVDEHDLPVTPVYLEQIAQKGFKIVHRSKWNNTVVVETSDSSAIHSLGSLPFVKSFRKVWESPDSLLVEKEIDRHSLLKNTRDTLPDFYGSAKGQTDMLNLRPLHEKGWRGEGVTIAVIDGGFFNADVIDGLKNCRILGTRNFVRPDKNVYEELEHGMNVLACIAANTPYNLVGTASDASFYLLVSEDGESEQLVEEDNWCAAVEYADSLGVDIITSSLGYYHFDDQEMNHNYWEQDGRTALNSCSASLAASRGILLLNSAGNSGNDRWKKIGFPADATDMLAVGAVDAKGRNTRFSSLGNTADGRIKPDVMAQGGASRSFSADGKVVSINGTSFSCPILCGAAACLLQACPDKTPVELIQAIRLSGNNAGHPDNIFGYGIPDMWKAYESLTRRK